MVRRDCLDYLEVSTYQLQQCTLQAEGGLVGHANHLHVSAEAVDTE